MRIWIDADAAPRAAREVVYRAAQRLEIDAFVVSNQYLSVPPGYGTVVTVQVDGGTTQADSHIVAHASADDLVVTHSVALASRLLPRGVVVLDARGSELTRESVGEHLSIQDYIESQRAPTGNAHGPPPFDDGAKRDFAAGLDRILTRMYRQGENGDDTRPN
ncbi:MAG: DUF188 domain-containing protein [Gemmatimonadota bacterium]